MQRVWNHIDTLAVPATLKHELMHNNEYSGRIAEYTILLSVSTSLEVLWLDIDHFYLRKFLFNIFQEAATP